MIIGGRRARVENSAPRAGHPSPIVYRYVAVQHASATPSASQRDGIMSDDHASVAGARLHFTSRSAGVVGCALFLLAALGGSAIAQNAPPPAVTVSNPLQRD